MNIKLIDAGFKLQDSIKNVDLRAADPVEEENAIIINENKDLSSCKCYMDTNCEKVIAVQPSLFAGEDFIQKVCEAVLG